jgi:hypothetical protein
MCRHPRRAGGEKAKKAIQLTQKKKEEETPMANQAYHSRPMWN